MLPQRLFPKMMIFGVKQTSADGTDNSVYDYVGVLYPEGHIGSEYQVLFNHDMIETVFFYGYENEERDYHRGITANAAISQ